MSEIKPALTPEEWANVEVQNAWARGAGFLVDDPARRHRAAALTLHGQPFGFTHADVKMAWMEGEKIQRMLEKQGSGQTWDFPPIAMLVADRDRWLNLADRIAALLPPEAP